MIEIPHERHAELLVGLKARDPNGETVGRLEEMIVEIVDGEPVVTEFHFGTEALLERITGFITQLPFFWVLARKTRLYKVTWDQLDLSDPRCPRVLVPKRELATLEG